MSDSTNLAVFGKKFQEKLVNIMLLDRQFSDQIGEVIKTNYFELKHLQEITRILYDYKKKYRGAQPGVETLGTLVNTTRMPDALRLSSLSYLTSVKEKITEIKDHAYVKDASLDFCKYQCVKEAVEKTVPLLKRESYAEIRKIITDALKKGEPSDEGHDYVKDMEQRFVLDARDVIPMPWDKFNNLTKGGSGRGELHVVVAATGGGKSFLLVSVGAAALEAGKRVAHYTLELSSVAVGQRYDACLAGVSLNELREHKEEISSLVQSVPGELRIKSYPTKTATTQTIRNDIEKAISNDKPVDMVVVDYADLLRPQGSTEAKRFAIEEIYEDLRAIAMEYNVVVWTASQTNRSGLNAEVITLEAISESFNKCMVADFIMTLSRTREDKENKTGKIFIAKNRNGDDGIVFMINMNPEYALIELMDEHEIAQARLMKEESQESLKDVYKRWKAESN